MTNEAVIHVDEGKYALVVQTLKKDADEPSAMANYLSQTAIVTNQDDTLYLTVMLLDHQTITGFYIRNQAGEWTEAMEQQVDQDSNKRAEMFTLEQFITPLHVRVQYEAQHGDQTITGDEVLRLSFREDSLEKLE